jgi:N-succinyldiaminopimelate aminotransferase
VNPLLAKLKPYPFEKLRALTGGAPAEINLSIGEPKHPTPRLVKDALAANLDGLATYPQTVGTPELREAIAGWLARRYAIPGPDPATQVLPVNGSREALFAFAQTVLAPGARVVCPNPFYQIYEGAALLAGATPVYGEPEDWNGVQLLYVCSPANPTGKVLGLEDWRRLFALSERHGFIIAATSATRRSTSTSPRSVRSRPLSSSREDSRTWSRSPACPSVPTAPGMRSGFVAGDAAVLEKFRSTGPTTAPR